MKKEIESVEYAKLLDVTVDDRLFLEKQIENQCKLTLLQKIKNILHYTRILFYNAYVHPLLDCCCTV